MADGSERQIRVEIDAGGEQIEVLRLDATESLSRHFQLAIDVLAPLGEIDWLPHLGKPGRASLYEDDQLLRHFNGIVTDAELIDEIEGAGHHYRLILRPKAYLYEQGSNFRIFQKKTVRDILETVLSLCDITADFGKLEGGARTRSYCVQYGESNFGFACRLMEEEGIYYFYAHSAKQHTLTLCSSPSAHSKGTASPLKYNPATSNVFNTDSAIRSITSRGLYVQAWHERVSSGAEARVTMRDFDFQQPGSPLESRATTTADHPSDQVEVYQFPGRFYEVSQGQALSDTVLAARRADRRTFSGKSKLGSIACGTSFELTGHPIDRYNKSYAITSTRHIVQAEHYRSGMTAPDSQEVEFEAIPANVKWKAPITTRRPTVAGPETAIVTGPPGEEIFVDKYARVRIQFHWDRDGGYDDNSSCWVRVSQTGGLGNIIIPRVGHEVLVDFINGDPDRPIVVGRVFNQAHMPIYPLPENKTRSLWRTKRYGDEGKYEETEKLDCDPVGVNEIRLEDKGGKEEFFVYAERDMNTRIRHEETHHVGKDQETKVGRDRKRKVKRHETVEIGKNRKVEIGDTDTLLIQHRLTTEVQQGDEIRKISGNQTINVGSKIRIEAGSEIVLVVGDSKITIAKGQVKIEAGKIELAGTISAKITAPLINAEASGIHTIKGTMVLIN